MPDRMITCADCGTDFPFTEREQEWFRSKGLVNDPRRCKSCRASRKTGASHGGGGGGGAAARPPRGGAPRETFPAVCASCGNECQVPFRPDPDRPVYCRDCFSARGKRR